MRTPSPVRSTARVELVAGRAALDAKQSWIPLPASPMWSLPPVSVSDRAADLEAELGNGLGPKLQTWPTAVAAFSQLSRQLAQLQNSSDKMFERVAVAPHAVLHEQRRIHSKSAEFPKATLYSHRLSNATEDLRWTLLRIT